MKHAPRQHQRFYLTFYLRVFHEDQCIGYLIDLSEEGIMIMSEELLESGKTYNLRMKLPTTFEWKDKCDIDRFVHFNAKCKWSKHDEVEKDFFVSGFQISGVSEDDNRVIEQLIKEYHMR